MFSSIKRRFRASRNNNAAALEDSERESSRVPESESSSQEYLLPSRPSIESPTYRVHLSYDPSSPPPSPGPDWTRFVCISDSHAQTFSVPPGDVLLHTGDLTSRGTLEEFKKTMDWIYAMEHDVKIVIAGNHDAPLHRSWYEVNYKRFKLLVGSFKKPDYDAVLNLLKGPKAQKAGVVYLEDSLHTFRAREAGKLWRVYGFPWQPNFGSWAFNYDPGDEAEVRVSGIPPTDILLTHGPPHGILDTTYSTRSHGGCPTLRAHLPRIRPLLHVFGQIHEGHGAEIRMFSEGDVKCDETVEVNAANAPTGLYARDASGVTLPFGCGWFQPVIVDLLDVE